jgi:hypothetical protein
VFTDVRTKSLPTAAVLMMLGHEPLEVLRNTFGIVTVRFPLSAELDLHRYHAAKQRIEQVVINATKS